MELCCTCIFHQFCVFCYFLFHQLSHILERRQLSLSTKAKSFKIAIFLVSLSPRLSLSTRVTTFQLGSSIPSSTRQRNRHHQRQQLLFFLSLDGLERPLTNENLLSHPNHNTHTTHITGQPAIEQIY